MKVLNKRTATAWAALGVATLTLALATAVPAWAARSSNITNTVHNLSKTGTGSTKSTTEDQICVFCHTPHGADTSQTAPLWNKTLQNTSYTPYTSTSLDANNNNTQGTAVGQPLGSSKLCLSCHDGVLALGSVRVKSGALNSNTGAGGNAAGSGNLVIGNGTEVTMPAGSGLTTGYTRLIDKDLSNDHPISITYDANLANRDGELRSPTMTTVNGKTNNRWGTVFGVRRTGDGFKPSLPLDATNGNGAGQVQCTTCHDPHIKGDAADLNTERNIKFLRLNRFQKALPSTTYSPANDIICLACHDKSGDAWNLSVHATADNTYKTAPADTRQFPTTGSGATTNIKVWQAACLNCHDTHTIIGARRLLREGTDNNSQSSSANAASGPMTPGSLGGGEYKAGGSAALEETCYQCHNAQARSILDAKAPDVQQDFASLYRMRITSANQPAGGSETHNTSSTVSDAGFIDCTANPKCGADLIESRDQLGKTSLNNRHVECSDCHNPHRVRKTALFFSTPAAYTPGGSGGTHTHTDATGYTHTNVISGALRGSWGVEPDYSAASNPRSFHTLPSGYTVRRGDPGSSSITNDSTPDSQPFVTREYQICLKCHSSYGYNTTPPSLDADNNKGLTPRLTNGLTDYTDQAKEFQAPTSHQNGTGDGTTMDLGTESGASYNTNNHRSWHPVMRKTGRTIAKRGITSGTTNWRLPWSNGIGTQTMYCSDCHGSGTASTTVIPTSGFTWGPHGSANPFILKGAWSKDTGKTANNGDLCFRCHEYNTYAYGASGQANADCKANGVNGRTGFNDGGSSFGDLHCYHNKILTSKNSNNNKPLQCTWCHIAIPHGWKNKALLVNLNDVGPELPGLTGSKEVAIADKNAYYTRSPYYLNAKLKVRAFAKSGAWSVASCGTAGKTGTNLITSADATYGAGTGASASQSGNASDNTRTSKEWMTATCSVPAN